MRKTNISANMPKNTKEISIQIIVEFLKTVILRHGSASWLNSKNL